MKDLCNNNWDREYMKDNNRKKMYFLKQ